jgi:hypothetical protein
MTPDDRQQAVFGGFDGLCSLMGLVLYLAIEHGAATALAGALTGALGAALSMSTGEWLSDSGAKLRPAVAMGLSTLACSIAPALPLLAGAGTVPILGCVAVALVLCGVIARLRPETGWASVAKTYGGFVVCVCGALGVTLALA